MRNETSELQIMCFDALLSTELQRTLLWAKPLGSFLPSVLASCLGEQYQMSHMSKKNKKDGKHFCLFQFRKSFLFYLLADTFDIADASCMH